MEYRISFNPDGKWYICNASTGEVVSQGFNDRSAAERYAGSQGWTVIPIPNNLGAGDPGL